MADDLRVVSDDLDCRIIASSDSLNATPRTQGLLSAPPSVPQPETYGYGGGEQPPVLVLILMFCFLCLLASFVWQCFSAVWSWLFDERGYSIYRRYN